MNILLACQAIQDRKCLDLRYDGYTRIVEVHAVGFSSESNPIMRVWQVSGGSNSGERQGWKLLRLDEVSGAQISSVNSQAPRPRYKRNDTAITNIRCQV